jgi:hypothetical protein
MLIPGSIPVTGFIGPTDSNDTYAVTDAIYGIDGFRSVSAITARNAITTERRREGMLVYTQADQNVWQLLPEPWSGTNADWKLFISSAATASLTATTGFLSLSGGTVSGDTIFTQGLSANTFTANSIYSLSGIVIGTLAPIFPLHIENSQNSYTNALIQNNSSGASASASWVATSDVATVFLGASSSTSTGSTAGSGVVGTAHGDMVVAAGTQNVPANIRFFTSGLTSEFERVTITDIGNSGFGTVLPFEKIHISGGTIRINTLNGSEGAGKLAVSDVNGSLSFSSTTDLGIGTGNYIPLSGTNGNPVTGDIEISDDISLSWNSGNELLQYNSLSTNIELTTSGGFDVVSGAILSAGTDLYQIFATTGSTLTGNYLAISGGTVTGNTIFTTGVTANTLSLTEPTYAPLNFPIFTSNPPILNDGDVWILSAATGSAWLNIRLGGSTKVVELT